MSLPDIDVCPALIYYILYVGSSFCLYGHGIFVFCSMYYNKICDNLHFFLSRCLLYIYKGGRCGRDRMGVVITVTYMYAISLYLR